MPFFRSERMSYCQLVMHQETAFDCLVELGYLGKVQFVNDTNADFVPNMKYVNEVQRCGDMLRIIQRLQETVNKSNLEAFYYPNVDEDEIPKSDDLPVIEAVLQKLDTELADVLRHCDALQERRFSIIERREVLLKTQDFLTGARNTETQIASYDSIMMDVLQDGSSAETGKAGEKLKPLNFITGSIPMERFATFERVVWRVSRGNAYIKNAQFVLTEEDVQRTTQTRYKFAFIIVFMGSELRTKLTKICQGFQIRIYSCPATEGERLEVLKKLSTELEDLNQIFDKTCEHKRRILTAAAEDLFIWRSKVRKMHAVYIMLNRLGTVREMRDQNQKYLQTDCWIPKRDVPAVRTALNYGAHRAARGDSNLVFPAILSERPHPRIRPPTYFQTNKFTYGFQMLIDSYGIATYQEANPAPYTIITFPFLFAVMFGDLGHGILLATFGFFLIWKEKKIIRSQKEAMKTNEIFTLLFGGRYIIFLMGLFSIYTGLIYNDLLSKALNIFGSSWRVNQTEDTVLHNHFVSLDPVREDQFRGTPYIMGVDPIWAVAYNDITLKNSLKMKIAIILGVLQMIFGILLSAWNALFFRNKTDFYLVFLPQITFLSCLFFYLVVLIFHKWAWYGGPSNSSEHSPGCAPSILIAFINMVLMKHPDPPAAGCSAFLYSSQPIVEKILLLLALLAVPILLCGKPLHFMYEHSRIRKMEDEEKKKTMKRHTNTKIRKSLIYSIELYDSVDSIANKYDPDEKLSEVWIHQGIHTIESVLGSVSHTASYLRLWALSLAHSQLSQVLWNMVLGITLKMKMGLLSSLMIFCSFAFFAVLTIAILVVMEGLSAFLHTLRLHWVEFQSKFYSGMGDAFVPFHFKPSKRSDATE